MEENIDLVVPKQQLVKSHLSKENYPNVHFHIIKWLEFLIFPGVELCVQLKVTGDGNKMLYKDIDCLNLMS